MININMQKDVEYGEMTKEEREQLLGPERLTSLHRALKEIGNPRRTLKAIHGTIGNLVEQLDEMLGELLSGDEEVIEVGGCRLTNFLQSDQSQQLTFERNRAVPASRATRRRTRRSAASNCTRARPYWSSRNGGNCSRPGSTMRRRMSSICPACRTCTTTSDSTCCTTPTSDSPRRSRACTTSRSRWRTASSRRSTG